MRGVQLTIAGAVILVLGVIFHLQGQAIVGPESSFMYSNPDWVGYGIWIAVIGAAVAITGITMSRIRR